MAYVKPNSRSKRTGKSRKSKDILVADLLRRHLGPMKPEKLSISERQFPFRVRADLQTAVDEVVNVGSTVKQFVGLRKEYDFHGLDLAGLFVTEKHYPAVAVPAQYEEIDIGEDAPRKCLKNGLWLLERDGTRFALLLAPAMEHHQTTGVRFQIATSNDAAGARITDRFFKALERAVSDCRSYRGKILSLEQGNAYTGRSTGIKVHKLQTVSREQVILPHKTLELLERNIIQFVRQREKLAKHGQATKKGILFYGPPGTGKSHTIHYLARALEKHTMLLITAEQVGLLDEYMKLARLLQPSVVVIEDVDLIARDRMQMHSPCEEALLNKLLNEMDGLKESADILFILTTNRPEALEVALSSRPGRVDQAIEFPLPDNEGRAKLVRLYGRGAEISDELISTIVARTADVSAAFIKELMRRSVQFQLERDGTGALTAEDVDNALNEMLFSGGSLNVKLLGGSSGAKIGFK
jgi:chromosomal replication initiation ATPase DnaA